MAQSVESIVAAVHALHGDGTTEQRRQADVGLCRWQQSFEAWSISDQLLSSSRDHAVQHTAASTLRTKIMYDLTQLPPSQHESLCSSILSHIQRYKNDSKSVLTSLALSFADLSIHMAPVWPGCVEMICQQLSGPQDLAALLICLKVLPEENTNKFILADPKARGDHAGILNANMGMVISKLEEMLTTLQDVGTTVEVLECFTAWVAFSVSSHERSASSQPSLFTRPFIEVCLKLLQSPTPQTADVVTNSLTKAVEVASEDPDLHREFLTSMLREIAASDGTIRTVLSSALGADDAETTLQFTRIYRFVCVGNVDVIAGSFHKDETLQRLFTILMKLTSVPYDVDDEARGRNGIAAQMLDFWELFSLRVGRLRRRVSSVDDTSHGFSQAEIAEMVKQQNLLFDLVLKALIEHTLIPVILLEKWREADEDEFYEFRIDIAVAMIRIARVLSVGGVLERVLQLLVDATRRNPEDQRTIEAHLFCIGGLLNHLDDDDGEYDADQTVTESLPVLKSLLDLSANITSLLRADPPTQRMDCLTRKAAAQFIDRAIRKLPISNVQGLVTKLLSGLGQQIFHQDLSVSTPPNDSPGTPVISDCLLEARQELSSASSQALLSICVHFQDDETVQKFLPQLTSAFLQFPSISPKSQSSVLEGIAVIINALSSDEQFLKASEALFEPILACIVSSTDLTEISKSLDQLTLILRSATPTSDQVVRREALGTFLSAKLWPLLDRLSKCNAGTSLSGTLIEKCLRTMKHGMRCVHADVFKSIVPNLARLLIRNSKELELHSTYLYVAEWLIVEYNQDPDICPNLKILFDELSALGLKQTEELLNKKEAHKSFIIEDLYGMFCRYFRFCPAIPGTSPSLNKAMDLAFPCLMNSNPNTGSVILSFYEIVAYGHRTLELEDGAVEIDAEATRRAAVNLRDLFVAHLPQTIKHLFNFIQSVPPESMVLKVSKCLFEYRKAANEEHFLAALTAALDSLPVSVLATQDYKNSITNSIMNGASEGVMLEIWFRCRQVNLRAAEAQLT